MGMKQENLTHPSMQSAGNVRAVEGMQAMVLYDGTTGRVFHMHQVITFSGGSTHEPAHHESNARAYAKKMGHKSPDLKCLHVSDFKPFAKAYQVDLKTRTLVAHQPVAHPKK